MEKLTKLSTSPEIEAKDIFSLVVKYEYKLIKSIDDYNEIEKDYKNKLIRKCVDLFLHRAKIIERRNSK